MTIRLLASIIIFAFVVAAVFGLYIPMMEHGMGCPFMQGGTALCTVPLAHVEHWQSAFTATLIYLLALYAAALLFIVRMDLFGIADHQYERYRLRERIPMGPTLFQELYSRGILNRRELHRVWA